MSSLFLFILQSAKFYLFMILSSREHVYDISYNSECLKTSYFLIYEKQ